jgi:predicted NAD-dependent protein-ADP-ribosyltransferase YbiA (DUF1768 family)
MVSCENRICPIGKVCNPLTGRCNKIKKTITSCNEKYCPSGKVCNPVTIRCNKVKKNDTVNRRMSTKAKMEVLKQTEKDKLFFYSKSKDVAVGKGVNEFVSNSGLYEELTKIKDFRKMLSNFHLCPFKYEGKTYNTIEHVFQAKKIEIVDKEKALWFTIESGNDIGIGDGEIARKNRKLCKLNDEQLKLWGTMKDDVMHKAAMAKYKVCKEARHVLKMTNRAQLWHIVSRGKPIRFEHLERIRNDL